MANWFVVLQKIFRDSCWICLYETLSFSCYPHLRIHDVNNLEYALHKYMKYFRINLTTDTLIEFEKISNWCFFILRCKTWTPIVTQLLSPWTVMCTYSNLHFVRILAYRFHELYSRFLIFLRGIWYRFLCTTLTLIIILLKSQIWFRYSFCTTSWSRFEETDRHFGQIASIVLENIFNQLIIFWIYCNGLSCN